MHTYFSILSSSCAVVQVMKYVKDGNKMRRPDSCPDILHELMSACWALLPDERPTFLQICARLLDSATPRWRDTCYFLTPEGREAVTNQEEMFQVGSETEIELHLLALSVRDRIDSK